MAWNYFHSRLKIVKRVINGHYVLLVKVSLCLDNSKETDLRLKKKVYNDLDDFHANLKGHLNSKTGKLFICFLP